MKKTQINFLLSLFVITVLFSCGSNKNEDILKYTTDTTLGLTRVNLDKITDKIQVDKILANKKDLKEDEKLFLQLLKQPKESGIDIKQPLYFIGDPGKTGYDPDIKAFFWISDKEKFQASMSKITKRKVSIDKKDLIYIDGLLTGSIKGNNAVLAQEDSSRDVYDDYEVDSLASPTPKSTSKFNEQYFTDFWSRKGSSNKAIKEQVGKSLVDDKDISGWVNLAALSGFLSKGYIETLAVYKLIKDSGIGFDFNFAKGSAEIDTKTFFNSDMKKVVEKYYSKNKINYDLVKNVELDNSKSFSIGFFSLDFMKYLIKESGFESTVNHYLASTSKTLDDITSTFTGDYAFADLKKHPDSTDYYSSKTALVLGIDPKKADNLKGMMNGPLGSGRNYMIVGDKAIFSEDNQVVFQFKSNKAGKNSKLDKKSGITAYSWSDGSDYKTGKNANVTITQAVNESKEDGGDVVSKTIFSLDKKDENALYYFIMNG